MIHNQSKIELKDIDNISTTGYRIISIFKMLLNKPYSEDEINENLQEDVASCRKLSQDTICIYINTLRQIGCEISRPSKKNDFKYVLKSHPFSLTLAKEEAEGLINIRENFTFA